VALEVSAGRSRNAHCLQANIHTAPQVIRLAGRFFKAALRRTKDAASKAFVQREARGQGLRLRHITLLPLTSPKLRQPLPAGSAGLPQLVQKPRRVSPPQRRKKVSIIFSGDICGEENTSQAASVEFVCRRRTNYARSRLQPLCQKGILFDSNDPAGSCPWGDGSACPKASQSFAAAAAKESLIIFFGDMCGEENTARPANVRAVRFRRTARALQQAANPFVKKVLLF